MIIQPHHISNYSRCPKKTLYTWNDKVKVSANQQIISNIIKTIYGYHLRKEKPALWRHIPGWLDRYLRESVLKALDPQARYKEAKNILIRVRSWYDKYYLEKYCEPGLINVPLKVRLDHHNFYSDSIDIVTMNNKIRLYDFDEGYGDLSGIDVYNDIKVQARIWGFWKASETKPDEYVRLRIRPQSMTSAVISINETTLERSNAVVKQITRGIKDQVFYPSVSEQCRHCPFQSNCSFQVGGNAFVKDSRQRWKN